MSALLPFIIVGGAVMYIIYQNRFANSVDNFKETQKTTGYKSTVFPTIGREEPISINNGPLVADKWGGGSLLSEAEIVQKKIDLKNMAEKDLTQSVWFDPGYSQGNINIFSNRSK